jgi:GTP-binding protein
MIIRSAAFIKSGLRASHFPPSTLPEVAFAGRSNVGKSSLLNTLMGRKALVRTSRNPGQTRMLNFFIVNEDLVMVDLPGYGFSRAPKEIIRNYQESMAAYLKNRKNLILVILLLDIRRRPSDDDKAFLKMTQSSTPEVLLVLTKSDTIGRGYWMKAWSEISRELEQANRPPIFFSARTGQGRDELWAEIDRHRKEFFPDQSALDNQSAASDL